MFLHVKTLILVPILLSSERDIHGQSLKPDTAYVKKILSVTLPECTVNNYIVRSDRDVIVVANIVTRRTIKAESIVMY